MLVNEFSHSAYLRSVQAVGSRALGETTAFTDDGQKFIPGLRSGQLTLAGSFDPTPDEETFNSIGTDDGYLVTVGPDGFTVGKPAQIVIGDISTYDIPAAVAETVGFTVETMADETVDFGRSLHDLSAETANGNATGVDNGASSSNGGVASLHVTAVSGTTPSATIKVQHSADDVTYADLITFTAATAATSERKTATGTVNQFVRAQWTITGTTPSFTFVVAFARR